MRHTTFAIQQFLSAQSRSGQSVADFCQEHSLKIPTFYAWRKKYELPTESAGEEGFCQLTPFNEGTQRSLHLPSGLRVELEGLSIVQIAELIVQIDRAHA